MRIINYFIILNALTMTLSPLMEAKEVKKKKTSEQAVTVKKTKVPLALPRASFVKPSKLPYQATQPLVSSPMPDYPLSKEQTSISLDFTGKGFIEKTVQSNGFGHDTMGESMIRKDKQWDPSRKIMDPQGAMIQHTWKMDFGDK